MSIQDQLKYYQREAATQRERCGSLALENIKLRGALQHIATFYDDGESDFSGDTPTSIARDVLEAS